MKNRQKLYQKDPAICAYVAMHILEGNFLRKNSVIKGKVNKCIKCDCKKTCSIPKTTDYAFFASEKL